ncbi:hypothetical protein FOZ62_012111, partial [Perkinsus olseni]
MEDFAAASCHKFSTNVVDKCLQHLSMSELAHVISVVLGDSGDEAASIVAWGGTAGEAAALSVMLRDRYGCAIVSRLLELAPSEMIERSRLVWKLKEQLPALRKSSFAKHLVAAVESTHAGSVPPVIGQFSRQLSGSGRLPKVDAEERKRRAARAARFRQIDQATDTRTVEADDAGEVPTPEKYVRGTCGHLEKEYLRLTGPAKAESV